MSAYFAASLGEHCNNTLQHPCNTDYMECAKNRTCQCKHGYEKSPYGYCQSGNLLSSVSLERRLVRLYILFITVTSTFFSQN